MSKLQKSTDGKRSYYYAPGDATKTRIYTLDNGLKVYLSENHDTPHISTVITVRAGAFHDPLGKTGLAHYLEHMMFKGTSKYGTTDYSRELPLLDEIERLYDIYTETTDPEKRKEIYRQIDAVSLEASRYCIPCEYRTILESIGATGVNAATSYDATYFECNIPSNEITRWAMVESERFIDPVFRAFHTELETVYEEYNEKESASNIAHEGMFSARDAVLYQSLPYRQHPILGTRDHLRNPSISCLKEFYRTWYQPCNMGILMCGDLDPDKTIEIIDEYFGRMKNNSTLPTFDTSRFRPLDSPVNVEVTSKEHESILLAWNFPGSFHASDQVRREKEIIDMALGILQNSCCGILDMDKQKHRINIADSSRIIMSDFSTLNVIATPNDGQTLEEAKEVVLEAMRKIGRGEFSDELIQSCRVVARKSIEELMMRNLDYLSYVLPFFEADVDYVSPEQTNELLGTFTREEIVSVWNKYFGDNYVCVFSRKGDVTEQKIEKPEITTPEFADDEISEFFESILDMETEPIEPKFADYDKDITKVKLSSGQTLLYVKNSTNSLFNMTFRGDGGYYGNPSLSIISDYLSRVGTQSLSMEELSEKMFATATTFVIDILKHKNILRFTGIQENFRQMLSLMADDVFNPVQDEKELELIKDEIVQNRKYSKSNFQTISNKALYYVLYGKNDYTTNTSLSDSVMESLNMEKVLKDIRTVLASLDTVYYWGPAEVDDVKQMLEQSLFVTEFSGDMPEVIKEATYPVTKDECFVVDFESPSAAIHMISDWGEKFDISNYGYSMLLEDYVKDILFKEVRESKALSYGTAAFYAEPTDLDSDYVFSTYAVTHVSKVDDCLRTMDEIIHNLPVSESTFNKVKEGSLMYLRSGRLVREPLLKAYLADRKLGMDHNSFIDAYEQIQKITLDDMIQFYRQKVQNNPFRYIVIGQLDSIDLSFLKSKGDITELKVEDVFGW